MQITVTPSMGLVPVMVMHLQGKLDGSNYRKFVAEAEQLYEDGARNLLLDLSDLTYMSSAGIVALHTVAMLFRGQKHIVDEKGWSAYRAMDPDRHNAPQPHVKLLGLNSQVYKVLDMVGFGAFFEVFTDHNEAIASFSKTNHADPVQSQGLNPEGQA